MRILAIIAVVLLTGCAEAGYGYLSRVRVRQRAVVRVRVPRVQRVRVQACPQVVQVQKCAPAQKVQKSCVSGNCGTRVNVNSARLRFRLRVDSH